jgi:hypothetical protein
MEQERLFLGWEKPLPEKAAEFLNDSAEVKVGAAATITDFKTNATRRSDQLKDATSHYAPPLNLYRQVLTEMTGMATESICCERLFTVPAEVSAIETDQA